MAWMVMLMVVASVGPAAWGQSAGKGDTEKAVDVDFEQSLRDYFEDMETMGTGLGPCCFDDGGCDDLPPPICLIVGGNPASIIGEGSCFVPGTCPQPGACCLPDGSCFQGAEADGEDCVAAGGFYPGPNTSCAQVICPFPQCPSVGSCFAAHANGGCDSVQCCNLVCNNDFFCCNTEWDAICVNIATMVCDTPGSCGDASAGDCGAINNSPGCNDVACCSAVCAADSFCCDETWDSLCVDSAAELCGIPTGACCAFNSCVVTTAQNCAFIGGEFIGIDVLCLDTTCDGACCLPDGMCTRGPALECAGVGVFQGIGTNCLNTACPEPGACCLPDGICLQDSTVNGDDCLAAGGMYQGPDTRCGFLPCPNEACPGNGPCLAPNFTPGCSNPDCCGTVCSIDPFCCEASWDNVCADLALDTFGCRDTTACFTLAGSCTSPNGTPGCSDFDCCNVVCELDPFCCSTDWDQFCVDAAAQTIECGYEGSVCCAPNGSCLVGFGAASCAGIGGTLVPETMCEDAGCVPCPWDCVPAPFGNGVINIDDLFNTVNNFGSSDGVCDNAPDNGDGTFGNGVINIDDILGVINNFGLCP